MTFKPHVRHYRKSKQNLNGGITVAFVQEADDIKATYAVCSRKDQFSKKTGRNIAFTRLLSNSKNNKEVQTFKLSEVTPSRFDMPPSLDDIFNHIFQTVVPNHYKSGLGWGKKVNPMTLSMYNGVRFTNETFGKPELSPKDPDFWAKLASQHELIQEELDEIADGIVNRDMTMLRDGICDVEVTNMGMAHLAGLDLERDMRSVLKSNLSKVCWTMDRAQKTVKHYKNTENLDLEIIDCPTMPGFIVRLPSDQVGKSGKKYPKGKFLKCVVGFHEPIFQ
jgi:NTP pyrophosphatase (non-canonical NTP hydrolase)